MRLTCAAALDSYYREHIAKKAVARRRAEFAIAALLPFFGEMQVKKVDIPACRKYREQRSDVKDATVRRELGVLKAAINHAVRWRRIDLQSLPSYELPPSPRGKTLWLYKEELAALLETANTHDRRVYRFVQLAYHTASRKAAIENLKWEQIDLEARRIDLQSADAPLTKKRRPIVPITEQMAAELASMLKKSITPYVLVKPDDIRPAFDAVALRAGLSTLQHRGLRSAGTLSPHVLRHSRATHLLEAGKEPWAVASLLGDSLTTVLKVYGHACPNYLAGVIL